MLFFYNCKSRSVCVQMRKQRNVILSTLYAIAPTPVGPSVTRVISQKRVKL